MSTKKGGKASPGSIAQNKKARFDYHIEQTQEAGLMLEGWEVKSLRAGKVQLRDAYVLLKNGEAYLHGTHITPLSSASTHVTTNSQRMRKLLLNRRELDQLQGAVERRGMTIVATALYWKNNRVKVEIGIAQGKKQHDKREDSKEKDIERKLPSIP